MTLSNLGIQIKIGLLLALLGIVTIGIAIYSGRELKNADDRYSKMVSVTMPNTTKLIRANRFVVAIPYAGYRTMIYEGNSIEAHKAAKEANIAYKRAAGYLDEVAASEPDSIDFINDRKRKLDELYTTAQQAVALGLRNRDDEARAILEKTDALADAFIGSFSAFNDKRMSQVKDQSSQLSAAAAASTTNVILTAIAGIVVALGLAFYMARSQIVGPLAALENAMRMLAGGNWRADVPGTERGDEVGTMAKSVLVFKDAGLAQEAAAEAKRRADAEQKLVVDTLQAHLDKLAGGDLTATIDAPFAPEYEVLKQNFNAAITGLRDLIGAVMDSAEAISTGSVEIAQASEDLARRTEGAAASLEETSAAVSEMDQRIKATAAASNKTVERANGAIGVVDSGRGVADEAMQAMSRVSESAKGIDNVIEGLDKIAFQTRVLAMNAAVEAGRAGEAGRGFAVVADLVSALAMRAEEEAGRARDQLTATQSDIGAAVEMVRRVDGALGAIVGDVNEVHALLATMANDNQAQASAVTQVATAVSTIDQSTQQNAAMVEQTSAAARNLNSEVSSLTERASRFNTGRNSPAAGKRIGAAHANAPAKRAAPPAAAKPLAGQSVAIVRQIGADVEDWASF